MSKPAKKSLAEHTELQQQAWRALGASHKTRKEYLLARARFEETWHNLPNGNLQRAIQAMHDCQCRHLRTSHLCLESGKGGKLLWEGNVEEFQLLDHPKAKICYAWAFQKSGRWDSFTMLKLPPIASPEDAVRAALFAIQEGQGLESQENSSQAG